jgi:type III secretion protein D
LAAFDLAMLKRLASHGRFNGRADPGAKHPHCSNGGRRTMSAEPGRFTLQIQSGLYEGVVETMPEGRYRVGSEIPCEIVLMEDGVAPHHVTVGLSGSAARIEAQAAGVTVEGIGVMEAGQSVDVPLPAGLSIGGVAIALADDQPPASEQPASSRVGPASLAPRNVVRALVLLQVAAVLVLMVVPNPVADALSRSDPARDAVASPGGPKAAGAEPLARDDAVAPPPPSTTGSTFREGLHGAAARRGAAESATGTVRSPLARPSGEDAARALQAEVERLGLLNVVVEAGSGIVTAAGTIEPSTAARWQNVQQWFDETFAGEITLVNGVSVKAERLPVSLGIEAVWRGEQSHLIIRGQKYLEGAVLDGGWTIHRIEPERVVLQRDGRLVAVKY